MTPCTDMTGHIFTLLVDRIFFIIFCLFVVFTTLEAAGNKKKIIQGVPEKTLVSV